MLKKSVYAYVIFIFLFGLPVVVSMPGCHKFEPVDYDATSELYTFINNEGDTTIAEMGSFNVKENRLSGSAKVIRLSFVRFPSTNPDPGYPIVYLAGGPGGSGINAARSSRFELFMKLRTVADVIAYDQRGMGISSPLEYEECTWSVSRPEGIPLTHQKLTALSLEAADSCAVYWRSKGIDLNAYNTLENARDIEDLRKVLGAEKLNLLGISYGTHLALAVLREYPQSIHRAVLAGVEGPDHTVKLPSFTESQFNKLCTLIEGDEQLADRYPNFKNYVMKSLDSLEANPVTITFILPGKETGSSVVVGRPELERLSISLLRDPSTMVTLPTLYDRINRGDFLSLATQPELHYEMEAVEEAMDAASGMSRERKEHYRNQEVNTVFGGGGQISNAFYAEAMKINDLGKEFRSPVRSQVPTLFISGTLDGRTPVENADEVVRGFDHASLLTIVNGGHSDDLLISSPAIPAAIQDFFKGLDIASSVSIDPPHFEDIRIPISLSMQETDKFLGSYTDGGQRTWTVIPVGTYKVTGKDGSVTQENSIIQVRVEPNGYTLQALNPNTFYVEIPGWEDVTFSFEQDLEKNRMSLTYEIDGEVEIRVWKD